LLLELSEEDETYEVQLESYVECWEHLTGSPLEYDDPDKLAGMLDAFDEDIAKHPEKLVDPGQDFWNAIDKLVEGVDLGK
jgi:hypothetical protein